jgi:hypothetical protein
MTQELAIELWPCISHVAGSNNPLVLGDGAMNRDNVLIPILWSNFRVYVPTECLSYVHNVVGMVRTNLRLGRIVLEMNNLSRYLDNASNISYRLDVKRQKNSLLVVEYVVGDGSAFGDRAPPHPH